MDFAKCTNFKNARKKKRPVLEDRIFFSKDSSDEVVYAGIDEVIAVFIFGCDRVVRAIELCIEAGLVGVQKGLFFRRKWRFVAHGIDEFLSKMGGIAESGHVRPLAEIDGACFVIAGMRNVGLETTDAGNVAIVVTEYLAALNCTVFGVSTYHFLDMRFVFDFSHRCMKGLLFMYLRGSKGVAKYPVPTLIISHLPRTYDALISHLSRTNFCLRFCWYYIHGI